MREVAHIDGEIKFHIFDATPPPNPASQLCTLLMRQPNKLTSKQAGKPTQLCFGGRIKIKVKVIQLNLLQGKPSVQKCNEAMGNANSFLPPPL